MALCLNECIICCRNFSASESAVILVCSAFTFFDDVLDLYVFWSIELDSGDGGSTLRQQGRAMVFARHAEADAGSDGETVPTDARSNQGGRR